MKGFRTKSKQEPRLGTLLVHSGALTEEQLVAALNEQNGNGELLGDLLIRLEYVTPEDVGRALATQLGVPFYELGDEFHMEQEEVALVPESVARRHCLIPLKRTDEPEVTVVMRDPIDAEAVATVRSITGLEVNKAVGTEAGIVALIDRFYRADAHIEENLQDLIRLEDAEEEVGDDGEEGNADQLRELANDAPVVRFVNLLLMQAVRDRASDIHFEPYERTVRVRLRVDGMLREVTPPPKSLYRGVVTRIKIMARMDIAERRLPLDGRLEFRVSNRRVDVRVSSLPEIHGEKLVLRILDRASLPESTAHLGFEDGMQETFMRNLNAPHGIVLVTGPTGSGKTSTLYSALITLRTPDKNLQTVEDPVEYQLDGINQLQVRPAIGFDFADALRSILRQDPDVVMIGEIRDEATARIAMQAALTGHLVLSTLHTNDAPSAFVRIKDVGIEAYLVAATVRLVLAQRLVRCICEHCKQVVEPTEELVRAATSVWPDADTWEYREGAGCAHCGNSGFRGRTAIFEMLEATTAVRHMLFDGTNEAEFRKRALESGMESLYVNGLRKVRRGLTTVPEVLRVSPAEELEE